MKKQLLRLVFMAMLLTPILVSAQTTPKKSGGLFGGILKRSKDRKEVKSKIGTYKRTGAWNKSRSTSSGKTSRKTTESSPKSKTYESPKKTKYSKSYSKKSDKSKTTKYAKSSKKKEENIAIQSQKYLGSPYRWGGESPKGFDCSGFTQYIFKKTANVNLPRTAAEQSQIGKSISIKKAQKGDLIFFASKRKKIDHVGIVLENNKGKLMMIHSASSTGVTITDVNNSEYWKKKLRFARRINM